MLNDSYSKSMLASSHLSGASAAYVEDLYECYLADPMTVPVIWKDYFDSLQSTQKDCSHAAIQAQFKAYQYRNRPSIESASVADLNHKQANVSNLIHAYRSHGHHHAQLDPLKLSERKEIADLSLAGHNLSDADLKERFVTKSALCGAEGTLAEIYAALSRVYCGTVGIEYRYITDNTELAWLEARLEDPLKQAQCTTETQMAILKDLIAAEGLEKYLGSQYVGQKRFSLEGGDSLIPLLRTLIHSAGDHNVKECLIGMAHRGRLNVLLNIMGEPSRQLYEAFEGKNRFDALSGDVKYHLGFSSDVITATGKVVHLALAFNPSHLEIISPVVIGSARARLRRRGNLSEKNEVVPILIHGDAAFSGQGVVMETFNFSQARGYSTGGSVHIVVNNQIGFTTNNPLDARSTLYCTDIAKIVQAPIFHVNADDPEAVVAVAKIAFDFRMQFKKDIVIDLVCYRRHGHNEADDPAMTQPIMYQTIKNLATVLKQYGSQLIRQEKITQAQLDAWTQDIRSKLDRGEPTTPTVSARSEDLFAADWDPYLNQTWEAAYDTTITTDKMRALWEKLRHLPTGFELNRNVKRMFAERDKMARGEIDMNWGFAETMAYAALIDEGHPVRLSGQDVGRGTFSHRHAVLYDVRTAQRHIPLKTITDKVDQAMIIDSVLSEEAVLAFEFGYATSEPNVLVIWEAQFGDFANGAQVVIDQFISSGEQKWGRLCGLVLLLPHGYEGQGPEHSSARLERYLQLCAQDNMQVCVPSTPAQIFHLLRRQMKRPFRKPLIVMAPKSLLRHKLAVSPLSDLYDGYCHVVLPEIDDLNPEGVRKIVLCSGKVYYELLEARRDQGIGTIALIRIEQLYPFPEKDLRTVFQTYPNVRQIVWCQEEPKNQGAWFYLQQNVRAALPEGPSLSYVGRALSASPAVGSGHLHTAQQKELISEALH